MTAIEIIYLVLIVLSAIMFAAFMVAFEKIATNKRNLDYYEKRLDRGEARTMDNGSRIAQLYKQDQHGFERPKIDMSDDKTIRITERWDASINRIYDRLSKLEQEKKKPEKK